MTVRQFASYLIFPLNLAASFIIPVLSYDRSFELSIRVIGFFEQKKYITFGVFLSLLAFYFFFFLASRIKHIRDVMCISVTYNQHHNYMRIPIILLPFALHEKQWTY